tara:strand:+ start:131 stop:478 length:348 start_codon:yes stop_codon:yes gene_type:complete
LKVWLGTIIFLFLVFAITIIAHAGAKTYGAKKDYTRQQKIQRGDIVEKKYTTCRLKKRVKSRHTGRQACIYIGGNKTYTLMYEDNCPSQYRCVYNPGGIEPNIDDVIDSLNAIKK